MRDVILGLDLGASRITAVIAQLTRDDLEILGIGMAPARGLHHGQVIDTALASRSIRAAVGRAERQAGCHATSAVIGIEGDHVACSRSYGMVAVVGERVEQGDVDRVKVAAGNIGVAPDREILHVVPQSYRVDDRSGIADPLGMKGRRLELEARVVGASRAAVAKVVEVCQLAGVEVERIVSRESACMTTADRSSRGR